ncbi:hypothetical protein GCM10025734_36090 [Kitasatospora paranensis]
MLGTLGAPRPVRRARRRVAAAGAGGAVFRPRRGPALELPLGGSFHAPEPDAWYDAHWSATVYRPPGDGGPVHLCLPARCLPAVSGHLRAGAGGEAL